MQNDQTTLKDLSILGNNGSIFPLLDYCVTGMGREALRKHILHPPSHFDLLQKTQETVRFFANNVPLFPSAISNGTMVMLEKFFESADYLPQPPTGFNAIFSSFFHKILNRNEYRFQQFSISHLVDFVNGCNELTGLLEKENLPVRLQSTLEEIQTVLSQNELMGKLMQVQKNATYKTVATLSYLSRRELKAPIQRMIQSVALIDAWHSLGRAAVKNDWYFPELFDSSELVLKAEGLYHPLLKHPVAYDTAFSMKENFLILTGANMSGKTTFMRALGIAALLAHTGSAVPARQMRISFLEGIITNMHVEDNILLGESLFMAEVQRMKKTATQLLQPRSHLVLMDELFKGTNVHDAYECTKAVVGGLLKHPHHIMVLSTHLYEVAQEFEGHEAIHFSYFTTDLTTEGNYSFTYQLKDGISNERIGYRILQKEGVIKLLESKNP